MFMEVFNLNHVLDMNNIITYTDTHWWYTLIDKAGSDEREELEVFVSFEISLGTL